MLTAYKQFHILLSSETFQKTTDNAMQIYFCILRAATVGAIAWINVN